MPFETDDLLDKPSWAPAWAPSADDERSVRWLRWLLVAVFVAGLAACVARGADEPDDPAFAGLTESFGTASIEVRAPDGTVRPLCLLHAESDAERARGLMEVTDLEGFDGMLFRFPTDTTSRFYMRNTPMPLSIAFVAADGTFVSSTDMAPCDDTEGCPLYDATGPYRFAIEVPRGDLPSMGLVAGGVVIDTGTTCAPSG
jgi:uncharacterized membrane protein (UPF0127 family)